MRKRINYLAVCLFISSVLMLDGCEEAELSRAQNSHGFSIENEDKDLYNSKVNSNTSDVNKTDTENNENVENSSSALNSSFSEGVLEDAQTSDKTITLGFAGDINFDENWATTKYMDAQKNGIYDCISADAISMMNDFDIFMINNEFTYSDRGMPLNGKAYTFRAKPKRVENMKILGADIVLMANNHVWDYGQTAFLDTLDVLNNAGIPYVGAGHNIEEASKPYYFYRDGFKIAYVAASKAEKFKMTPQATSNKPGILRCYDENLFLEEIRLARKNADYVVASVHWGTEYDNNADNAQRQLAGKIIEAGADVIIGTHPHVLQGVEYIDGKPVFYSLGNFWFNNKDLYTCLIELSLNLNTENKKVVLDKWKFIPCHQQNLKTTIAYGSESKTIISFMNKISFNVKINEDGFGVLLLE